MQIRILLSMFFMLLTPITYAEIVFAESGWINVKSVPSKVNITINEKFIGETPISQLAIEQGKYTLVASKPHYSNKILQIKVSPLKVKNIEVELNRLQDSNGWINIKSTPDNVKIHINGDDVGETPINQLKWPSGNHSLRASKKFYNTKEMSFSVNPFIVKYIEIKLKKRGGWKLSDDVNSAEIDSGFGMLTILTKEGLEADVFLDSEKIPRKTPLTFEKISAGEHIVELRYKDKSVREKVIINPSELKVATISLDIAKLTVSTTPVNANITIKNTNNNFLVSNLSPASFYLKPGNYSLYVSKDFFKSINKIVEFTNNSILEEFILQEERSHLEKRINLIKEFLHKRQISLIKKDKHNKKINLLQKQIKKTKPEELDRQVIQKDSYYQKSFAPGIFSAIVAPISLLVYFMSDSIIKNPKYINYLKNISETVYTNNQFIINNNIPIEDQFEGFSKNYNYITGVLKYELIRYNQEPQNMIRAQNALIKANNEKIYNEIYEIKEKSGLLEMQNELINNIEQICQSLTEIGEPCEKSIKTSNFDYFEKIFNSMVNNK